MALVNYPKPPINEKLMRVVEKILAVDKTLKLERSDYEDICHITKLKKCLGIPYAIKNVMMISTWKSDAKIHITLYDEKLLPKLLELFPGDDTIINIK
jgi:hypothetical protein